MNAILPPSAMPGGSPNPGMVPGRELAQLPDAAIDAATRVICHGLPLPADGDGLLELAARGRCLGPDCPCWEGGRAVTQAAISVALRVAGGGR